jgi:hypothetical protein
VPSGVLNGSNTVFTLANNFVSGSVQAYLNGLRQKNVGNDFSETGANQITFVSAPISTDVIICDYLKI